MSQEHVLPTIELIQQQIADLDKQLTEKKRMVNDLCALIGRPSIYSDSDLASRSTAATTMPDQYYGKGLAPVVRMILEKRKAMGLGAATVNEIYEEMTIGGYHFQGKNDDNNKRGLYISLGKNTSTFHKLPNGTYGLKEWYPDIKETKAKEPNGSNGKDDDVPLHEELKKESVEADEQAAASVKAK
jgi:hypothetical protein